MAITCPRCGRQYDATLFQFGREIQCDCGTKFDITKGHLLKMPEPIEGVLVDIAGVLYVGDEPIAGAAEALDRLQESGTAIRFLTNTTRSTRERLLAKLRRMGFDIEAASIFSAPIATRKYLEQHQFRPHLLVHPDLTEEFAGLDCDKPNAVVVGDAADVFQYRTLNEAFRILMDGGALISMGSNRCFREKDGLSLDMGPFVEALRFASGVEPIVIGKPSASFFQLHSVAETGLETPHFLSGNSQFLEQVYNEAYNNDTELAEILVIWDRLSDDQKRRLLDEAKRMDSK